MTKCYYFSNNIINNMVTVTVTVALDFPWTVTRTVRRIVHGLSAGHAKSGAKSYMFMRITSNRFNLIFFSDDEVKIGAKSGATPRFLVQNMDFPSEIFWTFLGLSMGLSYGMSADNPQNKVEPMQKWAICTLSHGLSS